MGFFINILENRKLAAGAEQARLDLLDLLDLLGLVDPPGLLDQQGLLVAVAVEEELGIIITWVYLLETTPLPRVSWFT
jgi:hypothetical protein